MPFLSSDVQDLPETKFSEISQILPFTANVGGCPTFPSRRVFPYAYLSLSSLCLKLYICYLHYNPGSWFYFLHLQMRTCEAQRDIKQLAQDSILTNGLDPWFVLLLKPSALPHTTLPPERGLAGGEVCHLVIPSPQGCRAGTPKLSQIYSTVLQCGRRGVGWSLF